MDSPRRGQFPLPWCSWLLLLRAGQIFPLEVGQMFCFKGDLRKTQGADFFVFLAANSLSSDGQLQRHFMFSTLFILALQYSWS